MESNKYKLLSEARQSGFSKLLFLIVALVVMVLVGTAVWLFDPAERLREARDRERISALDNLKAAIQFYLRNNATDPKLCSDCAPGTVFADQPVSIDGLSLRVIDSTAVGGTGWVPIDFSQNAGFGKTPLLTIPVDPSNKDPFVYTFTAGASGKFKLTAKLEAKANEGKMVFDGGTTNGRYEIGTDLLLTP